MQGVRSGLFTAAVMSVIAGGVHAQSINIDFGSATFSPVPAASYGGAANSPGVWNSITATTIGVPFDLVGLNGSALNVTLTHMNDGDPSVSFNHPSTSGQIQNLLDDGLDLGGSTATDHFQFNGLANGEYLVYTYAWSMTDPTGHLTSISVNGLPTQTVGGAFGGSLQQGITHALHAVTVTNGQLNITTATVSGFSTLNGIQLVYTAVPGPGVLTAFAAACVLGRRRRRA